MPSRSPRSGHGAGRQPCRHGGRAVPGERLHGRHAAGSAAEDEVPPPRVAPAASASARPAAPRGRCCRCAGSSRRTAVLDVACGVSPPAISRSGPCASTTSRESPPGSWYGAGERQAEPRGRSGRGGRCAGYPRRRPGRVPGAPEAGGGQDAHAGGHRDRGQPALAGAERASRRHGIILQGLVTAAESPHSPTPGGRRTWRPAVIGADACLGAGPGPRRRLGGFQLRIIAHSVWPIGAR